MSSPSLSLCLLLRHRGLKVSHCDVCHPHSVTTMHHPPCCSLSTPPVHLSPMPISASCARPPHGHLIPPSSCSSPSSTFRRKLPFPAFLSFSRHAQLLYVMYLLSFVSCALRPSRSFRPALTLSAGMQQRASAGAMDGRVNVKPLAAMIMFITRCVSRCPWINTNWRSTLQR